MTNKIPLITPIKSTLGLCLFTSFFSFPAFALDLSKMVADSISAHPEVNEKVHVYREVVRDESIANSGWRPSVDLNASTGLYDTESPSTGNRSVDYDSSRLELSVTQNLFNGYDTTHQIKQTQARAKAALYDLYDTADNIALDAIQSYVEVIKQQRLFELATENVNSHEGILVQIRERNNSGVGRRSQLQQTEGRVARSHSSLIAQQNNLYDSLTLLHQILGRYIDPKSLVEPVLPILPIGDLDTLIDQALINHPATQVAKSNVSAANQNYKRSLSSRYPSVDLRLAYEIGDDIGGAQGNTEETSLTLNLTYNLFRGGADNQEQLKNISATHQQRQFSALVRRQIINTLRLAWLADDSLSRQITFLEQHVIKSKETVASYREEFFIGQRDLIDLLDSENESNAAQIQYTEAFFDSVAARYRIYESLGLLFNALNLETNLSEGNFQVASIEANLTDEFPLPDDYDVDNELDISDHCDNSQAESLVNIYGCLKTPTLDLSYVKEVIDVNDEPVIGHDQFDVDNYGILVISRVLLLSNDTDADGDVLSIIDVGKPSNGKLAFKQNRNLIYRPTEGFIGVDSFTYTVSDGNGATATATVRLNVIENPVIDLSQKQYLNFKYNRVELTNISRAKVIRIARKVKQKSKVQIELLAFTDSNGSESYNSELSKKRASALKQLLIDEGIKADIITAKGLGEQNPIADNDTKSGQAINRRGELTFWFQES